MGAGHTLAVALIADTGVSNIGTFGTLALAGSTLRYTGATAASTARVVDVATSSTASAIEVVDPSATLTLTGKVWNSGTAHSNVVVSKTGAGTLGIAGAGGNVGLSLAAREGVALLASTTNAVYEIRALDAGATVRLQNNFHIFGGDAISTTGNIRMTGGTLDLNGFNETVNRVSGTDFSTAGTGTITSAAPATFTFGNNLAGQPSRFAGTITGSVSLAVKGTNRSRLPATAPARARRRSGTPPRSCGLAAVARRVRSALARWPTATNCFSIAATRSMWRMPSRARARCSRSPTSPVAPCSRSWKTRPCSR